MCRGRGNVENGDGKGQRLRKPIGNDWLWGHEVSETGSKVKWWARDAIFFLLMSFVSDG